ncbi:type I DNA topoisomerase [Granulicella cerasi]|uniref:DNA topoisomerase 1 n=1 Tax=Granulicella cerasi TaxID=741063 RepID=A0ABW1ZC78_9BACT|nr:type I DNA topoisomerase [Granulicella cerasi]
MAKNLVIVESPAKAKTIGKYLGSDYVVEASVGHIMDLPKNDIGVELKRRTFEPTLIVSPGKEKVVDRLKKLAAKSDAVFLAPDPDREGEAIAAHLKMQLLPAVKKNVPVKRVTFNEITKKAVNEAFKHVRDVDENRVDAQQTRRVLDRLVGYQISPLLWDKVKRGLSAGRVQTVALRLIVERERAIAAFPETEYWNIDAVLTPQAGGSEFTARMVGVSGQPVRVEDRSEAGKYIANALPDKGAVDEVLAQLERAKWSVRSVEKKEVRRKPKAPFTTSQLQQQAAGRLGFGVRRTMGVAQRLYEGIELGPEGTVGLITYMRTDSTRMSPDAVDAIREHVRKQLGDQYIPATPNTYASKKDAQDAHEAIRPTSVAYTPEFVRKYLSDEQFRLYSLIWERAVTSQMVPAVFDQTTVDIQAKADMSYDFRTTGSVLKFAGYLWYDEENKKAKAARADAAAAKLEAKAAENAADAEAEAEAAKDATSDEGAADRRLPALEQGAALKKQSIDAQQKFTQPPPRFNEASLVKTLEENGIGRPSTYASIINTIQERDYVKKIRAKLVPTEIGMVVTDLLVKNFPYIFKVEYTADLENELDAVEAGNEKWTALLGGFYEHLEKELKVAENEMEDIKAWEKPSAEVCEKCGAPLILKWGKFGSFYSCSNFTKEKPVAVSAAALKKDAKAVLKKVHDKFGPMDLIVRGVDDAGREHEVPVGDPKKLEAELKAAVKQWKKVVVDPDSCDFTKENVEAKPDLTVPGADAADEQEDEACDNCGRTMVLRNGPWGPFMACPGYNEDPPCKTIRKLTQKVQSKPPVQLEEPCPKCGKPLLQRDGQYGEFIACSGYPKCKYVKQELLDVPCPKCGSEVAVRKNRRGDTFYGCTRYPKCDFTSNQKLVNETCPKCESAYLVEVSNAEGTFLVCPNNSEKMPKRRAKKGEAEVVQTAPDCSYEKKIGPPKVKEELAKPDPEKTRPVAIA